MAANRRMPAARFPLPPSRRPARATRAPRTEAAGRPMNQSLDDI